MGRDFSQLFTDWRQLLSIIQRSELMEQMPSCRQVTGRWWIDPDQTVNINHTPVGQIESEWCQIGLSDLWRRLRQQASLSPFTPEAVADAGALTPSPSGPLFAAGL